MLRQRAKPISIAPETADDCDDCAGLLLEQLREHGVQESTERLRRVLTEVIAQPSRGFLLLARGSDRAVGVAYVAIILSAEHCGPVGWLEELYVAPEYRGQGIGTGFMTAVMEQARGRGIVGIELEVDAGHRRAEVLYQRFGFRRLDRSRWVRRLADEGESAG
jgi:GNAT superfamily N-acetyltransferase